MDRHDDPSKSPSSSHYSPEGQSRRRSSSFLSSIFSHNRARSASDAPPPSYNESLFVPSAASTDTRSRSWFKRPARQENVEDALELLRKYDTVILVDDSGSMTLPGSKRGLTRWHEAGQALETLAETAQEYDGDGVDIYFMNSPKAALNVKTSTEVRLLFSKVKPSGLTPTGERLEQLVKPRIVDLEQARIDPDGTPRNRMTDEPIKRVNFIVITDGAATDEPKYPIIDAASRLKAMTNLCMVQLGIQFVQIGNDSAATRALRELDDNLHKTKNIRDIVDTTPYAKLNPLTAQGLIKILLGGINRRIDEMAN
ncbi:hypothetical protein FB45DRAFT_1080163 [Roridomyces roridus]|uniref:VWFA domain-containing protein n=1 Tax=Roridomyces roridus TaxID=1738132 RepID=A0AAD7FK29_9AGAR|nr:hypothetical protein FB45DRAFT_1080163 [Roridomyces roridus]